MGNGKPSLGSGPSKEAVEAYEGRAEAAKKQPKGVDLSRKLRAQLRESRQKKEEQSHQVDILAAEFILADSPQEKEALSRTAIELTESPKDFKEVLLAEQEKYEGNSALKLKYPTFREYIESEEGSLNVKKEGMKHIRRRRRAVLGARLRNANEEAGTELDEEAQTKQDAEISAYVKKHKKLFEKHYDMADDDPKKLALKGKFFNLPSVAHLSLVQREALFESIGTDVFVEKIAMERYESAHSGMVTFMAKAIEEDWDLDDKDILKKWEEMVEEEIKKNAEGALKEAAERREIEISYQYAGEAPTNLETPHHVAHYAGVNIVGMAADGAYIVKFPNSPYQTRMYIQKKEGAEDYNNAKFGFYDQYADPSKSRMQYYDKNDVRKNVNRIFVDFLMNRQMQKDNVAPDEGANKYFTDQKMMDAASAVLGQELDEVIVTTPGRRKIITNLLYVIMKDDENGRYGKLGSFSKRVEKIGNVLKDPARAAKIRELLAKDAGGAWTLSTLLEAIDYPEDFEE